MRLAIWSTTMPRQNSTHQELFLRQLDEIELAERIGIDQIWLYEHHLNPTAPVPSPNLLIAAAAPRTRRIRFASMVNILPFRNPLLVAEEAALLDNLTGGRLDMGIGRGLRPPEFEAFDIDQQRSREMFLEAFDIIRRVWADEDFVHRGRYWTVRKNGPLAPPLVQKPHPPFLVSAQSEESLRWAAHSIRTDRFNG
jgi:alkanesulfonate monooxygenase SsuD/methylene tetrahydromethanopterin reductase-like flavin-dependent oxidoreductase (luciferase family)